MRPLWKGSISFGLVSIPVGLYSAIGQAPTIDLDLLRKSDRSRIRYKKVAEADGKEVTNEQIVKGYEYEKDQYVIIEPEDFQRVQIKSAQMVEIKEFIHTADIDPRYFDKPYFLAPEKAGAKAYALLHAALKQTGLAGLSKVVVRPPREHIAVLIPLAGVLVLETLHFADELRDPLELQIPKMDVGDKEMKMALSLVQTMESTWEPEKYHDEYREGLLQVIEEKAKAGGKLTKPVAPAAGPSRNVIDLVELLQQSLGKVQSQKQGEPAANAPRKTHSKARGRKTAKSAQRKAA